MDSHFACSSFYHMGSYLFDRYFMVHSGHSVDGHAYEVVANYSWDSAAGADQPIEKSDIKIGDKAKEQT